MEVVFAFAPTQLLDQKNPGIFTTPAIFLARFDGRTMALISWDPVPTSLRQRKGSDSLQNNHSIDD